MRSGQDSRPLKTEKAELNATGRHVGTGVTELTAENQLRVGPVMAEMGTERPLAYDPGYDHPLEMDGRGYVANVDSQGCVLSNELHG